MNPKGGTELQFDELKKRLPEHYWKKINLTTSVPEKTPIEKGKLNILWLKNSHDQPNIQPWFSKPENHNKYDWYIFNSHWNFEKYRLHGFQGRPEHGARASRPRLSGLHVPALGA